MRKYFVADFNVIDVPTGGGEWVDDMIIKKFNLTKISLAKLYRSKFCSTL